MMYDSAKAATAKPVITGEMIMYAMPIGMVDLGIRAQDNGGDTQLESAQLTDDSNDSAVGKRFTPTRRLHSIFLLENASRRSPLKDEFDEVENDRNDLQQVPCGPSCSLHNERKKKGGG
jgi:hypothetical protein